MKGYIVIFLLFFVSTNEAKKINFTKNKGRIDAIKKVYVVTDTFLMEHYSKNELGINLPFNKDLGLHVFEKAQKLLSKSINAEFVHAASVIGLHPEGHVYTTNAENTSENIFLPEIDDAVGVENKTDFLEKIEPLFERIHRMPQTRKEKKSYVPDMLDKSYERVSWLDLDSDEAVLMILTSGLRKRPKGSTGKTVASAILTLGMGIYIELAPKYFNAALVGADGKLLWVGYSETTKGIDESQIEQSLYYAFKTMPYKLKKPQKNKGKKKHYSNFK